MIDYDEFLTLAHAAQEDHGWYREALKHDNAAVRDGHIHAFAVSWISGGITGGSCWNDGGHYSVSPEPEAELTALSDILEKCGVSFREGRNILKLARMHTQTDRGYYGNFEEHTIKYVPFDEVYDKLVEFGKAAPHGSAPTP